MAPLEYSRRRSCAILVVGIGLGLLLAYQAMMPIRAAISTRYVDRGDEYLRQQEFDVAADEYVKALVQNPANNLAKERQVLARRGLVDIKALRQFYVDPGEDAVVRAIDAATVVTTDPKAALETGVRFYVKHQYNYAYYSLEHAVQLDPSYSEAWHYLALTYQELAKQDGQFTEKATQAFAERNRLTPKYLTQ